MTAIRCATITKADKIISLMDESDPTLAIKEILRLAPLDLLTGTFVPNCSLLEAFCGSLICSNFVEGDPPIASDITRQECMDVISCFLHESTTPQQH